MDLLGRWMDGGKITRPLQYDRSEWLMEKVGDDHTAADVARVVEMTMGVENNG